MKRIAASLAAVLIATTAVAVSLVGGSSASAKTKPTLVYLSGYVQVGNAQMLHVVVGNGSLTKGASATIAVFDQNGAAQSPSAGSENVTVSNHSENGADYTCAMGPCFWQVRISTQDKEVAPSLRWNNTTTDQIVSAGGFELVKE